MNPEATSQVEPQDFRVAVDGVRLGFGGRSVFRGLSCGFPRGRISVVLGGSGSGKSTLLRLVGGLQRPDSGSVRVAGVDVTQLSERALFRVRDSIGMLFQGGALLDSLSIFDNVALPLREHREYKKLSEKDIEGEVARRLAAVGLPDAGPLYPRQLSGGMNRRAALARAIITDPEVLLVDEPFSGLDPVNVRRIEDLLVEMNERLHLTMVVTSHHIDSSFRMAHRIVFIADGEAIQGSPEQLAASDDERVAAFLAAEREPTGTCRPPRPAVRAIAPDEPSAAPGLVTAAVARLGAGVVSLVLELGRVAVFAALIVRTCLVPPPRVRRFVNEVFDVGVLSLAIVCLSGLTVGAVLALQAYSVLATFGAESQLGVMVGHSLIRELGPVLTGLLVTGRAGSAMAAEIASMVTTQQLDGLRMMSIDPVDFVVQPKSLAMFSVLPFLSALFICAGIFGGYLIGVQLLGVDVGTYLANLEESIDFDDHVAQSLVKALVFGALVGLIATFRGYHSEPTSAGVSRATTQTVVVASVSILIADYVITALWGV